MRFSFLFRENVCKNVSWQNILCTFKNWAIIGQNELKQSNWYPYTNYTYIKNSHCEQLNFLLFMFVKLIFGRHILPKRNTIFKDIFNMYYN